MRFTYDDGGRKLARYKGTADDCVCRSIAIATGRDYQSVYSELNEMAHGMRQTKQIRQSSSRTGVARPIYHRYLIAHGFTWTATMHIGSGCHVHLKESDLPMGTIICRVSKHMVCVIDHTIHDTYDCSRDDTRCVYGYYSVLSPH